MFPVPAGVDPQPPVYHSITWLVPPPPPFSVSVVLCPLHIVLVDAVAEVGLTDRRLTAKVSERTELKEAIEEMIASKESYFLEVAVEMEENVFPMIPTGSSVSDIRLK